MGCGSRPKSTMKHSYENLDRAEIKLNKMVNEITEEMDKRDADVARFREVLVKVLGEATTKETEEQMDFEMEVEEAIEEGKDPSDFAFECVWSAMQHHFPEDPKDIAAIRAAAMIEIIVGGSQRLREIMMPVVLNVVDNSSP